MVDEFDGLLEEWHDTLEHYEAGAAKLAEVETDFKAWMASTKKALMDTGESGTKAEATVMAMDGWAERYLRVQKGHAYVETMKKRLLLCQAKVDVQRSRHATGRRV